MPDIIFLSCDDVLTIHQIQIDLFGGSDGIRDQGLLESAVAMPQAGLGTSYFHDDIFKMAAAYMYHIIKNHAFIDGNKRTGVVTALTFLTLNGVKCNLTQEQVFILAMLVATSKISKDELAKSFTLILSTQNANQ